MCCVIPPASPPATFAERIVSSNKVDKEGADPNKVRGQLSEYGLLPEEYGGTSMFVDVSAKSGLGIEKLLESIILTADAALDLRSSESQQAQGVAIEAHLDKGRGPVATVLVQRGTLKAGDSIVVGDAFGRVRAMLNDKGESVESAGPAFRSRADLACAICLATRSSSTTKNVSPAPGTLVKPST